MRARFSWRRSLTPTPASTPIIPTSPSAPASLVISPDLTSAIILAMIALLIGYELVSRIFTPVPIRFAEAIPIACLGLAVNIASAWLLSGGGRDHDHGHGHRHGHAHGDHDHQDHDELREIATASGVVRLEVFEDGAPPRFRLRAETGPL